MKTFIVKTPPNYPDLTVKCDYVDTFRHIRFYKGTQRDKVLVAAVPVNSMFYEIKSAKEKTKPTKRKK